MRTKFGGYYPYTDAEYQEIWDNAVIVLDANVLLNLYRYEDNTRENFIRILQKYKERLWIPYNIGEEFFRNRVKVIRDRDFVYHDFKEKVSKEIDKLDRIFEEAENPKEKSLVTNIKVLRKKAKEMREILDKGEKAYEMIFDQDEIIEQILSLYDTRVGEPHTEAELQELYKKIEKRYQERIPPGYEDEGKEGNKKYGDGINWLDIIAYAKAQSCSIIFVTADTKKDWFFEYKGQKNPNVELYAEFYKETGKNICIYRPEQFLKHAALKVNETVPKEVIENVEAETNAYYDLSESFKIVSDILLKSYLETEQEIPQPISVTKDDLYQQKEKEVLIQSIVEAMRNSEITRVYELAKELNIDQRILVQILQDNGINVLNNMSRISRKNIKMLQNTLNEGI